MTHWHAAILQHANNLFLNMKFHKKPLPRKHYLAGISSAENMFPVILVCPGDNGRIRRCGFGYVHREIPNIMHTNIFPIFPLKKRFLYDIIHPVNQFC